MSKKRLRSQVLAMGMVGVTMLGAGTVLYVHGVYGQGTPENLSAGDLLKRGQELFDRQQYAQAKAALLKIDPATVPDAQRGQRQKLLEQIDQALSRGVEASQTFDNAQAAMENGQLAQACRLFEVLSKSPTASTDLKQKATIQLALVREKQAQKAPAMKDLLKEVATLLDAGKLDEAQNALYTIDSTGADLGWQDNAKPAKYQRLIAEKRLALSKPPVGPVASVTPPPVVVAAAPAPAPMPAPIPTPAPTRVPAVPVSTPVPEAVPMAVTPLRPAATPAVAPAPAAPGGTDIMAEMIQTERIRRERALTYFDASMRTGDAEMQAGHYQQAVDKYTDARLTIETNRQFFSEAEGNNLWAQANDKLTRAKGTLDRAAVLERNQATAEATKVESDRNRRLAHEREQQVSLLMDQALKAYDQQQFQQAGNLIQQVLVIDPTNNFAKFMDRQIRERDLYFKWETLENKKYTETQLHMINDSETMIPYQELLIYPEDWPELSRRRQGDQQASEPEANRRVRDRLEANLTELSAEQQSFEKVIKYLAETQGVNITVNWNALTDAGVDKNTQVTVNLRDVPFRKALNTVLSEAGPKAELGYTVDDGVLTISTKTDLQSQKYQVIRVYDIRDLLVQPDPATKPPSFDLSTITSSGTTTGGTSGGGGGTGTGGGSLFGGGGGGGGGTTGGSTRSRDDIVKDITSTITSTVAPESWRENAGNIGSIKELNGQLIINQTVDNQLAVFNLLQQLRETRALQIAIEARMLLVQNSFLDDFGFGWNALVPPGNLGGSVTSFTVGSNSFFQVIPPATGVPGSPLQGKLGGGMYPFADGSGATNAFDTSIGMVLDGIQLNLFLRATQADQRATTVTAPRVTLFNGQRGYLAVTNQQNFVSNFNQTTASAGVVGSSAVGTSLSVSTLTTGVVLDVEATVSADRRYVVMKLKPQLSNLDGIDTFNDNGSLVSSSSGSGYDTTSGSSGSGAGGFVQLPRITYTTVDTMVSVPDGGTLLIGGQKIAGESEIEVGVPVLSKIPGINRLFTNKAYTRDERTLLILVRPKIIIQREEEYRTFGMNFDMGASGAPTAIGAPAAAGGGAPAGGGGAPAGGAKAP